MTRKEFDALWREQDNWAIRSMRAIRRDLGGTPLTAAEASKLRAKWKTERAHRRPPLPIGK